MGLLELSAQWPKGTPLNPKKVSPIHYGTMVVPPI